MFNEDITAMLAEVEKIVPHPHADRNKRRHWWFLLKAKRLHGEKYDYSRVVYKGCLIKIIIICPIHGPFEQTPNGHLKGYGCKKCGWEQKIANMLWNDCDDFRGGLKVLLRKKIY